MRTTAGRTRLLGGEREAPPGARPPGPRRRLPRAQPWNIGSVLPWAASATVGDPLLVLVPFVSLVGLVLVYLALGLPGEPEVLVPVISLPPVDAYQDVASVDLVTEGAAANWLLRALFLALRVAAFGTVVALAAQRVRPARPDLAAAVRRVRERLSTLAFLQLLSFAAFGATLLLRAGLAEGRSDGSVSGALLFGLLFLPNAFVAATVDGLPAGAALRRSFAWVRHRPLGHIATVLLYAAALDGIEELAGAGETARPAAFPLTLLAFTSTLVTTVFLVALTRRYEVLYSRRAPGPSRAARPRVALYRGGLSPAERTRDRRATAGES